MADWQALAREAAAKYGFDPNVFVAQMGQEAHGQDLTSPAGAQGPAQFMPATARSVGLNNQTVHQIGPAYNAAAKLMAGYLKQYGNVRDALVAYNAGPGRVGGALPAETRGYLNTILGAARGAHPGTSAPAGNPVGANSAQAAPAVSGLTASAPDSGPQTDATGLIQLASQQRQAPRGSGAAGIPAPAVLSDAYRALSSSAGPAPKRDISALIDAARTPGQAAATSGAPGPSLPAAPAGAPAALTSRGGGISPHARPGDPVVSSKQSVGGEHPTAGLAGYPARDFFAPSGSHAVAPVTGKVIKLSGHDPRNGPTQGPHGPLGWSVYIQGTDGKTYFLTHMGARNVKVGQTVKQGQVIGTVADYDKYGTPSHIHMGVSG